MFQFENLTSILKLPGKKTFNNMDRDFLEKRKKDLNAYLQVGWLLLPGLVSFYRLVAVAYLELSCAPVAAQPGDGEGLSHSDSARLRLLGEQGLQQGQGRVRTQGS